MALSLALGFGIAGESATACARLVMGVLRGAPYQISGPTGAISEAPIVVANQHHLRGIWITQMLAGVMIVFSGVFRLGRAVI